MRGPVPAEITGYIAESQDMGEEPRTLAQPCIAADKSPCLGLYSFNNENNNLGPSNTKETVWLIPEII